MYAADATVTGDPALLKRDFSAQLRASCAARRRTSGRACASTTSRTSTLNHPMNVDSAEYANIVLSFTRFYDQARRAGMAAMPRRSQAADRVAVDRARDRRLLDARRLHELGLRPRLPALAPVQEARAHAAGADRDRVRAARCSDAAVAALGEVHARPRASSSTTRTADRDGGIADALFFNVHAVPQDVASARLGAARVLANAARAIDAGLGRSAPRPSRPRCTPTTRTSAAWRHDARVQHRDRRRQPARVPVRRDRPGAAVRRQPGDRRGRSAARRRRPSARSSATSTAAACWPRRSAAARSIARVTPLRLTKAPSGAGARRVELRRPRVRRRVHRPARDGHGQRLGGLDPRLPPVHAAARSRRAGTSRAARPPRAKRRHPVPEHGPRPPGERHRRAQGRLAGRRSATAGSRSRACRRLEVKSRYCGYTVTPLSRPAGAGGARPAPAPQSSAPDAGPDAGRPDRAQRALLEDRVHGAHHAGRGRGLAVRDDPHLTVLAATGARAPWRACG